MQMMPPPVKPTATDPKSQSGRVSRRRLFSLVATAAVASGLGIALGSTLRFQVLPVGEAPLFKPQQDFPPLAEWPPQVPSATEREDLDTRWTEETPPPQLVYNERSSDVVESYNVGTVEEDNADATEVIPTSELPDPVPTKLVNENNAQDITTDITNEVFDTDRIPPVVSSSTSAGELDDAAPEAMEGIAVDNNASTVDRNPWFNKQPASESQFADGPVIIYPENSSPDSEVVSD